MSSSPPAGAAPAPPAPDAGRLRLALERLRVLGRVLYVAAHPDDENTHVLSWLVNGRGVRAAYLSMTRGGGGQNLIGAERGPMAALLRTQELLQARSIDGAEQFFTRARDFGYSKRASEALSIWGEKDVLGDVVWVIRRFRPDVIVTRFAGDGSGRHGHHTASAQLAVRAFKLAADKNAYPEQLRRGAQVWQARRVVWNAYSWRRVPSAKLRGALEVDIGGYSALLGESYGEIAARSRTMHKSQGFGRSGKRGPTIERFKHLAGARARSDLLEGIPKRWTSISGGGARVERHLGYAIKALDPMAPERAIPHLAAAAREMKRTAHHRDKQSKLREVAETIAACAGLYVEARAPSASVVAGGKLKIDLALLARRGHDLYLEQVRFPDGHTVRPRKTLQAHQWLRRSHSITVPRSAKATQPYWLSGAPSKGLYHVADSSQLGLAESAAPFQVELTFAVGDYRFTLRRPVIYRFTDRVRGERRLSVQVAPAVMVTPSSPVLLMPGRTASITVRVRAGRARVSGHVELELPAGVRATPSKHAFKLAKKGAEAALTFKLRRGAKARGAFRALPVAVVGARRYSQGVATIDYPHIRRQTVFPSSAVRVVPLSLRLGRRRIGYVMGAGDDVAKSLRRVGYQVTVLTPKDLDAARLRRFDALVMGVRAYNTHPELEHRHKELMRYVRGGGTLLVQYNTSNRWRKLTMPIGPWPLSISRGRITDEQATLAEIKPRHRVLRAPNRIGSADFDGWVQERGLYFASSWDKRYRAVLRGNDKGESPLDGALIVGRHGRGHFVYTGLSFFRQLPAGVAGAYRLFANLLAL
ncbi:MAG: PIG-L family deacetylase [Myxococcales bacterium]|nr:PIG-L family deacetylase [Myxococcales bacterium]